MSGGWGYASEQPYPNIVPTEPYSNNSTFYTLAILLYVCWGCCTLLACFTAAQCTHTYHANYSFVPNLVVLASAVAMCLIARRNTLKGKVPCLQRVQYIHYGSVVGCVAGLVLSIFWCDKNSMFCKAFLQASCTRADDGWVDKKTERLHTVTLWVNLAIASLLSLQLIILIFCINVIRQIKDYATCSVGYGGGAYYYGSATANTGIQNPLTYSTPGQSTYPTRPASDGAAQEDININIKNDNQANASTAVGSRGQQPDSSRLPPLPGSSPPPAPDSTSTRSKPSGTSSTSSAPRININIENINKADAKADVEGQAERKRMLNLLKDLKRDVEDLSRREDKSENQSSTMDIKLPPPNNPIVLMPQPTPPPTKSAPAVIGFRY